MVGQGKAKLVMVANSCPALENLKCSATSCGPRQVSMTTVAVILNWTQHVEILLSMHTGYH